MPGKKLSASVKTRDGLQITEEAYSPNNIFFITRTIFRLLLVCIVLAAIFGFFGSGYFDSTEKGTEDISVEYEKYLRVQAGSNIVLHINNNNNKENFITVIASPALQNGLAIKSISPQPIAEELSNEGTIYYFRVQPGTQQLSINFNVEPIYAGGLEQRFMLKNGNAIRFYQFVYP